jgi:aldose 1-epimerase
VKVIDPAAHYGVNIIGPVAGDQDHPDVRAAHKQFVAIEHQYNFADPFGKEWGKMDTGMVTLKPGQAPSGMCGCTCLCPRS